MAGVVEGSANLEHVYELDLGRVFFSRMLESRGPVHPLSLSNAHLEAVVQSEYRGLRVTFRARLGAARIPMQIDVGFGNAIEPGANDVRYPTLLDAPAPDIRAYPHEAVVAEKLHALVVLGEPVTPLVVLGGMVVVGSLGAILGRASRLAASEEPPPH